MKITHKGNKNTAFVILEKNNKAYVRSNKIYSSGGYGIDFDASLSGNTLEVVVKNVIKPWGHAIMVPLPAIGRLFENYINSSQVDYDFATRTISGPSGSKLEIILKDDCLNPGTEDSYECIL